MDKGEGLEKNSNDWERATRKHIDWGAYKKILRKAMKKKRKKKIEKKKKLKLSSLKGKSKIKEGERLSSLWRAKEISIKERHNKSQ
jgi:Ni/Co efflux regulator RcnB